MILPDDSVLDLVSDLNTTVAFTMEAAHRIEVGQSITLTFYLGLNPGYEDIKDLHLEVLAPSGFAFMPGSRRMFGYVVPENESDNWKERSTFSVESLSAERKTVVEVDLAALYEAGMSENAKIEAILSSVGSSRKVSSDIVILARPQISSEVSWIRRIEPEIVYPGVDVIYALNLVNSGAAVAEDVVALFDSRVFGEIKIKKDFGQTILPGGRSVSLGNLEPGGRRKVEISANVPKDIDLGTFLSLNAVLTSKSLRPTILMAGHVMVESAVQFGSRFSVLSSPSLIDAKVHHGFEVDVAIHNEGVADGENVKASLNLPANVRVTNVSGASFETSPGVVDLLFHEFKAEQTYHALLSLSFEGRVEEDSHFEISGNVTADSCSPHRFEAITFYPIGDFKFGECRLSVDPVEYISVGQELTITLSIKNIGDARAENLLCAIDMPKGLTYVPASTYVNGFNVEDVNDQPPFLMGEGLVVDGVPADDTVELEAKFLVNGSALNCSPIIFNGHTRWSETESESICSSPLSVRAKIQSGNTGRVQYRPSASPIIQDAPPEAKEVESSPIASDDHDHLSAISKETSFLESSIDDFKEDDHAIVGELIHDEHHEPAHPIDAIDVSFTDRSKEDHPLEIIADAHVTANAESSTLTQQSHDDYHEPKNVESAVPEYVVPTSVPYVFVPQVSHPALEEKPAETVVEHAPTSVDDYAGLNRLFITDGSYSKNSARSSKFLKDVILEHGGKMITHVLALRVLFPDVATFNDGHKSEDSDEAISAFSVAVREKMKTVFVNSRLSGEERLISAMDFRDIRSFAKDIIRDGKSHTHETLSPVLAKSLDRVLNSPEPEATYGLLTFMASMVPTKYSDRDHGSLETYQKLLFLEISALKPDENFASLIHQDASEDLTKALNEFVEELKAASF